MEGWFFKAKADGTLSNDLCTSGKGDIFSDASSIDAKDGLTSYRKIFFATEKAMPGLKIYVEEPLSVVRNLITPATDSDIVDDAESYVAWKGCGTLALSTAAGPITSLIVDCATQAGFNPLDLIKIGNEFLRVKTVSWTGNRATITIMPDERLNVGYPANTAVSSCIEFGEATISAFWIKCIVGADSPYISDNSAVINVIG